MTLSSSGVICPAVEPDRLSLQEEYFPVFQKASTVFANRAAASAVETGEGVAVTAP